MFKAPVNFHWSACVLSVVCLGRLKVKHWLFFHNQSETARKENVSEKFTATALGKVFDGTALPVFMSSSLPSEVRSLY